MRFSTWWRRHGIAILGYAAAAIPALLEVQDLIPPTHAMYWKAAGILAGLAIARQNYTNQQGPKS